MNDRRSIGCVIPVAFASSILASLGLTVLYALGGQPQLEGALLGIALGGIAVGLLGWAARLMPHGPYEEDREEVHGDARERHGAEQDLDEAAADMERRGFLGKLLGVALAALGVAALFPIRSLGTRPGRALFHTAFRAGMRLVTADGEPVRVDDVPEDGVLTVFPEGHTDAADSQTLLIRLPRGVTYRPPPGREGWSPEGFVAFSKVCTHAGCPVGLYQADSQELFCPCHQSVFAVLEAARPTDGPATRPLPQLPLGIRDGFLIATGDYPEPVGPGFWSRGRA